MKEYKVFYKGYEENLEEELNNLAKEGWAVVTCYTGYKNEYDDYSPVLILEREKND